MPKCEYIAGENGLFAQHNIPISRGLDAEGMDSESGQVAIPRHDDMGLELVSNSPRLAAQWCQSRACKGVKVEPNSLKVEPIVSKSAEKTASLTPELPLHLPTESAQNNICPPTHLPETDGGMEGGSGHDSKSTSKAGHEKNLWVQLLDAYQNFYDTAETYSPEHELRDATNISKIGLGKLKSSLPALLKAGFARDDVIGGWTKWLWSKFPDLERTAESPIKFPVAVFADEARFYIELAIKESEEKELNVIALEEKRA